jgi:hypothetical protein
MIPIKDAIAHIRLGWSESAFITERAVAMRAALDEDLPAEAEMIAHEIEGLQSEVGSVAEYRFSSEVWRLDLRAWAEILIGGGFKRGRAFEMPCGSTMSEARARAVTIFSGLRSFEVRPDVPTKRTFASYKGAAE